MQTKVVAAGAISRKRRVVKRHAEQWARICEAQRTSGQTIEAFCREHGIADSSFSRWRKKLADAAKAQRVAESGIRFLSVPLLSPAAEAVEVEVEGMRVRVRGPQATRLVETLVARMRSGVGR